MDGCLRQRWNTDDADFTDFYWDAQSDKMVTSIKSQQRVLLRYILTYRKTSPPNPSPMERGEKVDECPPLHRRGVGGEVLESLRHQVDSSITLYQNIR